MLPGVREEISPRMLSFVRLLIASASMDKSYWARPRQLKSTKRLRLQTERAIQGGVFGVTTFAVDDEIFWGNDGLPLLSAYLQGKLPTDKAKVEEILSRPRAADRPRKSSRDLVRRTGLGHNEPS
jgi:hypothetical protein